MKKMHISRRMAARTYRIVRILVRLVFILVLLALICFVYLRLWGVPAPLLREAMHRANAAGIPVEVDAIILTIEGWRADNVRYYSRHPDDLAPIFQADQVYFRVKRDAELADPHEGMDIAVRAVGIRMAPSVEWGVAIPAESPSRTVEQIDVMLSFRPDRLTIANGTMEWLGCRFKVDGDILKRTGAPPPDPEKLDLDTVSPVAISAAQFQQIEDYLQLLSLPEGATIEIGFEVDTTDYSASRMEFHLNAEQPSIRQVEFSKAEISGHYSYPRIQLERAGFFQGKKSLQVGGEYNVDTGEVQGALYNSITSNRLLLLLPESVRGLLAAAGVRIDYLPRLELNFGPAAPAGLANHISGAFTLRNAAYQGLEVEALRGEVNRTDGRLTISAIQGSVKGQEERAGETGSCMQGGPVSGSVFWDDRQREFGVKADIGFDPLLLCGPLDPVEIAVEIIDYFRFTGSAPQGHVELGAQVDDWGTFYLDIQAVAQDVEFRRTPFSSINATAAYGEGVLTLDPIAVRQGADFAKGALGLDFRKDRLTFDVQGRLSPAVLEDVAYPDLNLFGHAIKTAGKVVLDGEGVLDWGTMQTTDFSAMVAAEQVMLPVGVLYDFSAIVDGAGPQLHIHDAQYGLYGGDGTGELKIRVDPAVSQLPYELDARFKAVDFSRFINFYLDGETDASGTLSAKLNVTADFSTNFFAVANGEGALKVEDGQLADLDLFKGFSRAMRLVIPGFRVFTITSLSSDFVLENGTVSTGNAKFNGNLISATGKGSYHPATGYDAVVQVHMLKGDRLSKVVRTITDPFMRLFEVRLSGSLSNPDWRFERLP